MRSKIEIAPNTNIDSKTQFLSINVGAIVEGRTLSFINKKQGIIIKKSRNRNLVYVKFFDQDIYKKTEAHAIYKCTKTKSLGMHFIYMKVIDNNPHQLDDLMDSLNI